MCITRMNMFVYSCCSDETWNNHQHAHTSLQANGMMLIKKAKTTPTLVTINGVSKSLPPTRRKPHGIIGSSRCNITENSCSFGPILNRHYTFNTFLFDNTKQVPATQYNSICNQSLLTKRIDENHTVMTIDIFEVIIFRKYSQSQSH